MKRSKIKWSKMEDLSCGSHYDSEMGCTYRYAAETWLTDKEGVRIASIERWSTRGNKDWSAHSRYIAWIYPNGEPQQISNTHQPLMDTTLSECKGWVFGNLINNGLVSR